MVLPAKKRSPLISLSAPWSRLIDACRFVRAYSQHLPLAFESLFSLRCTVALLSGAVRGGEIVTVLYVGRGRNYDYLTRTLLANPRMIETVRTSLLDWRRHAERMWMRADVMLGDLGWPYNGRLHKHEAFLEVPDWMNMAVELKPTWEDTVRSFRGTTRNNDLRLIRRNGYYCEAVRTRAALEEFYDGMYLPYTRHKHQTGSTLAPRSHVVRRGTRGCLLRIRREGKVVAAGVVYPEDRVLFFLWMGLPADVLDSPPEAAISALYYFGLRHAFDNGYAAVDFTGTRAFLGDGAFRFKRKWGALVDDTFSPSSILVRLQPGSRRAAAFCRDTPVVARSPDGLEAVFVTLDSTADETLLRRLQREYGSRGIDRITVLQPGSETATKCIENPEDQCQYLWVRCTWDELADKYAGRSAGRT